MNMIKEMSKKLLIVRRPGFLVMTLALLSSISLQGCLNRAEVKAEIWLNSGLPKDVCDAHPELMEFGMYRMLDSGKFEVLPYCSANAQTYYGINAQKFDAILDELLPEKK